LSVRLPVLKPDVDSDSVLGLGGLKDPSRMREGADVEAPLALTSFNSGNSGWFSMLEDGMGFGLNVEKERVIFAKACSSSSRDCGLWTVNRLLPSLFDVFFFFLDCNLFDF